MSADTAGVLYVDRGRSKYFAGIARLIDYEIRVGIQSNAKRKDGISMVTIATIHEYGAPRAGIPARPHLRPAIRKGRRALAAALWRTAKAASKDRDPLPALKRIGLKAEQMVRDEIDARVPPPLHPKTIKRKKSDFPLVDTGQLRNAYTSEVVRR